MNPNRLFVSYDEFVVAVEAAGFKPRRCNPRHWQVIGGLKPVNVWPSTGRVYMSGAVESIQPNARKAISTAIQMAKGVLASVSPRTSRRGLRELKLKLWNAGQKSCFWCGKEFKQFKETTADHVIPLSRGGSNRPDNIVLAHEECNKSRGNDMTPQMSG